MSTKLDWRKGSTRKAERTATDLASMSRSQLKRRLRSVKVRFKMDFTDKFLDSLSKDELRHVLLAAQLNAR